jgi:hypothetical protein
VQSQRKDRVFTHVREPPLASSWSGYREFSGTEGQGPVQIQKALHLQKPQSCASTTFRTGEKRNAAINTATMEKYLTIPFIIDD